MNSVPAVGSRQPMNFLNSFGLWMGGVDQHEGGAGKEHRKKQHGRVKYFSNLVQVDEA
ncbi:MAG: hypothetical protein IJ438_08805 [Clostridia bacterium]|nr:hypothetical protein [Clostridia bacterium]